MLLAIIIGAGVGLIAAGTLLRHSPPRLDADAQAVREALSGPGADPALTAFYAARGYRPLWADGTKLRPEASQLIGLLRDAGQDDLDPRTYDPSHLEALAAVAGRGDPTALARAEVALSRAMTAYVGDLRRPPADGRMVFADPALRLQPTAARAILAEAGGAPSLRAFLAAADDVNPIYDRLRAALAAGYDGHADLIRANLERARALPHDLGGRFILVNAAAQELWMFEEGRPVGSMRVVVGKPGEPTPVMEGVIRYADLDPYWNVPPDLARNSVAPRVLRQGVGYLAAQHLQVLSDWTPDAVVIDPAAVDWTAVADGRQIARLRQLPGPDNMMGAVKFMFPNPLGVYLHDTPLKDLFGAGKRDFSAGCVRVEKAAALAQWLLGRALPAPPEGGAEVRVDLPNPVPVYIVYLTAAPDPAGGLDFPPDIYRRDPALMAQLVQRKGGEPEA